MGQHEKKKPKNFRSRDLPGAGESQSQDVGERAELPSAPRRACAEIKMHREPETRTPRPPCPFFLTLESPGEEGRVRIPGDRVRAAPPPQLGEFVLRYPSPYLPKGPYRLGGALGEEGTC